MKKAALEGDSFNATSNGCIEKYTNRIDEVSTFREKKWGKATLPLINGLCLRGYVGHFSGFFADVRAKKPTPNTINR